jgi:hypothetical protein
MRCAGHAACMGEIRNEYTLLVGKPEGKGPLGRPRHRWEDNIKMELMKQGGKLWTGFIWLRIGTVGGFLTRQVTISLSRRRAVVEI